MLRLVFILKEDKTFDAPGILPRSHPIVVRYGGDRLLLTWNKAPGIVTFPVAKLNNLLSGETPRCGLGSILRK